MRIKSALATLATLAVVVGTGIAQAAVVQGTSYGTFSSLSGCDNSGFSQNCRIVNTSQGNSTQVQWGSTSNWSNFSNPSTLTAVDVNIGPVNTNATGITIAQLTWFNSPTEANQTPSPFGVNWNLTVSFSLPTASSDSETFNLLITNPVNPTADNATGFTLADLNGLAFNLTGVTVSNLQYVVEDGSGNGTSTLVDVDGGKKWINPEENTARLYIKADFTAVPEPASLALFGAGLLGLGLVRRARRQA